MTSAVKSRKFHLLLKCSAMPTLHAWITDDVTDTDEVNNTKKLIGQ